jgi:hypothetical protein
VRQFPKFRPSASRGAAKRSGSEPSPLFVDMDLDRLLPDPSRGIETETC